MRAALEGSVIVMEVADTGIGISPADQARIFERFYRADQATVQDVEGSGLGLAIVKSLVEMHGGSVSLHSALGQGSTFVVRLPLAARGRGATSTSSVTPTAEETRLSHGQ